MTQIAYSGLFWTRFRVSRDLFTDLTAGKATVRTFLPILQQPVEFEIVRTDKIITYQTPQSNLPIVSASKIGSWYVISCSIIDVVTYPHLDQIY